MKIDMEKQLVILEEEYECTFIVYSYKYVHADGRVSYPLCFIFSSPMGCKPEQQMMYAGSKNQLVQAAELTKVIIQTFMCISMYLYIFLHNFDVI
ncbi:hypothetical protein INR49_016527 [Caranx melampygus]|nr:hypothetical protein INR49_016527 [Caranx melampygus]